MVRFTNLNVVFGGQVLFREANWFVGPQDRVGLIGVNGSGKTTLLRIVAGQQSAEDGAVELPDPSRVGYLAQTGFVVGPGTVREEARAAFDVVLALQEQLHRIEAQLARARPTDEGIEKLTVRHGELLERLAILGADEIERRVHQVLTGLGFRPSDFERRVADLSGGWQMRAALARILLRRPQLLLLDEPTNHLDIEAREWLEGYLQEYPYAFVVVSHDRYFLDVTVSRLTEIVEKRLEEYAGNYSFYETERDKRLALRLKAYELQQDEIRHMQRYIDSYRSDKRRAAQVQSRIRRLEQLERLEPPKPYQRSIAVRYPECEHSGRVAIELVNAAKSYGELTVFEGLNLRVLRGQRLALVGPNGAGKSTLMRLLAGQEAPDHGKREGGFRLATGFFAQEQGFRLERDRTVLETVTEISPVNFIPNVRGLLGAFLFSGDSVDKRVAVLSGGELNRLALACLLVRPTNLLLLDEPTNHLDIPAKEVLLDALRNYPGTVVFVSHDRHFLDALADHIVEVGGGRVREYPGNYSEFLWSRAHGGVARSLRGEGSAAGVPGREARAGARGRDARGGADAPSRRAQAAGAGSPARPAGGASGNEGRRAVEEPRRGRRLADLEGEIAELEDRRRRYTAAMSRPDVGADREKVRFYRREYEELEVKLNALYAEWERLSD